MGYRGQELRQGAESFEIGDRSRDKGQIDLRLGAGAEKMDREIED